MSGHVFWREGAASPHSDSIPRFGVPFRLQLAIAPAEPSLQARVWQKLRAKASFLEPALSLPERQLHVLEGARPQTPAAPGSLTALPLPSGSPGASTSPLLTYQMGLRAPTYSLEPGLRRDCSCPGVAPHAQNVPTEWELNHDPVLYLPLGVGQTWRASRYCPKRSSPTAGLCSGCPPNLVQ